MWDKIPLRQINIIIFMKDIISKNVEDIKNKITYTMNINKIREIIGVMKYMGYRN